MYKNNILNLESLLLSSINICPKITNLNIAEFKYIYNISSTSYFIDIYYIIKTLVKINLFLIKCKNLNYNIMLVSLHLPYIKIIKQFSLITKIFFIVSK